MTTETQIATKTFNVVRRSGNAKLTTEHRKRPFIATWQGKNTCPGSCPFLSRCYAANGPSNIQWNKLRGRVNATEFRKGILAAFVESKLSRPRLRVSTAGDLVPTTLRAVFDAVHAAVKAGKRPLVIGYTHNWRNLDPAYAAIPGMMRIRASVDTIPEKMEAERAGWSTAVTINWEHEAGRHKTRGKDLQVCPQQTGDKADCFSCMACVTPNHSIGFRIHGHLAYQEGGAR